LGQTFIVSESSIREGLQLGDDSTGVEVYPVEVIKETFRSIGYRDEFPKSQVKKCSIHPKWNYIAHCLQHCFANKRSGFDTMSAGIASIFVALVKGERTNVSKFILTSIRDNQALRDSKKFLMYPRFFHMLLFEGFSSARL
jgi:hypothetical protein